ncbi:MAPK regulated corepressor interacting protein 2-like [Cimex lectularius]|uniref:Uncharacterized protein n=1 Tax=Cimex lectularius TaxID=79782 RepID=A0A8I6RUP4_CIMLE|nr:MAPK regulated corepressor interacting protein 2-like [Cimex lectularius]
MSSNGKRMSAPRNRDHGLQQNQEELIKFIWDSWNKVCQEYQKGNTQGSPTVAYHIESEPNPMLKDFVPFDLEAYWGKRLVQNISTHNA